MRALAVLLLCLGLTVGSSACNKSGAVGGDLGEMSLGPATAKVTVIEYASLGCPICARWNNENWDAFKAKYIDSGRVHYIYREMMTGEAPVAMAGFLLAHCVGKDKYFQVLDAVYREVGPLLETDQQPLERDRLIKVAESAGLSADQFNACVSDDKAIAAEQTKTDNTAKTNNIESTPTFVINGKVLTGYQDMPTLD
ncbi:MAG TPA: thioredoxin domain-containing protein, partial [Caulobacteraceae bacterium]|nr:thioredoxin domain-containing protein [Caulobacteraceae bacterium]